GRFEKATDFRKDVIIRSGRMEEGFDLFCANIRGHSEGPISIDHRPVTASDRATLSTDLWPALVTFGWPAAWVSSKWFWNL
ncbi:hypothetical protein TNCT_198531, partial [Trichonephila clavata]